MNEEHEETAAFERRLSDADSLSWRLDANPVLRSHGVHIEVLDRAPDWDRLATGYERLSRLVPRFRQRVVESSLRQVTPAWIVDDRFDLSYHLRHVQLPAPGSMDNLLDLLHAYVATPLDRARPLWEATVVEGLEGGRAALFAKTHHSFLDGAGWVYVLGLQHDRERDAPAPPMPPAPAAEQVTPRRLATEGLLEDGASALRAAPRWVAGLLGALGRTARHPRQSVTEAARAVGSVAKSLQLPPGSPLFEERTLSRRVVLLDVSLDDVRRAGKAVDGTVNDTIVAGLLDGLARYHEHFGRRPTTLNTAIAINVRRPDDPPLGNRIAAVMLTLPADILEPAQRIRYIHDVVLEARSSPGLPIGALAPVLNRVLPPGLVGRFIAGQARNVDIGISNMPGHRERLYLAGAEVGGIFGCPVSPQSIQVSIISYAGTCCIAAICDAAAVADPGLLGRCLKDGLDDVIGLAEGSRPATLVAAPRSTAP